MNITRIVNRSQSLCNIAVAGANLFLAELVKKCVTKKGVYNAAIGGKISIFANICWTKTLYRGFSKGGNHKENARGEGLENSAGGGVFIVRPST